MLSFGEKEKTGVPGKNLLEASGGENRNKKTRGNPFYFVWAVAVVFIRC